MAAARARHGQRDGPVAARRIAPGLPQLATALPQNCGAAPRTPPRCGAACPARNALQLTARLLVVSDAYGEDGRELPRPDEAVGLRDMGVTVLHLLERRVQEPDQVERAHHRRRRPDRRRGPARRRNHTFAHGTVDAVTLPVAEGLARDARPAAAVRRVHTRGHPAVRAGGLRRTARHRRPGRPRPGAAVGAARRARLPARADRRQRPPRARAARPEGVLASSAWARTGCASAPPAPARASCCAPSCSPSSPRTRPRTWRWCWSTTRAARPSRRSTTCRTSPASSPTWRTRPGSSSGCTPASPARSSAASRCSRTPGNVADIGHYAALRADAAAGPAAAAAPVRRHRRVRRTAHRQARLHRPVPVHRPHRPVHRRAPAAVQPAHRGRQAQGPGHLPVVPARPAHVLRGREPHGPGHHRRLPPAAAARLRLPQGRHLDLRAVQRGLRLRRLPWPIRSASSRTTNPLALPYPAFNTHQAPEHAAAPEPDEHHAATPGRPCCR